MIKQWDDKEQGSHWLSPAIQNLKKPVVISFWAADNYLKQTDLSYAAVVDAVAYQKGKELSKTSYLLSMPWDDARKSNMWGRLQPEGLKWKYYQALYRPKGESFRLKFYWPKPIVRGECYLTDLQVREASPEDIALSTLGATQKKVAVKGRYSLHLSTPVTGNLFYQDDPLRFECLLFTNDGKDIGTLKSPELRYRITDFENFFIASGKVPFNNAKPVSDKTFYKRYRNKKHNRFSP